VPTIVKDLSVHHFLSSNCHEPGYFWRQIQKSMKSVLFLFASLLTISLNAQISGTVSDEAGKPLEFVNVILQNTSDSVMVKAVATNEAGLFIIEDIASGSYFLQYRLTSYAPFFSTAFEYAAGAALTKEPIKMLPASTEMQGLEGVYVKPLVEIKADKTIFNVEGTTNAVGLNALELLRKAPGVMVDNNEKIMGKGKGGIVVYIDGKLTPLDGDALKDMLKNMQSSNIESIEIITNPSAKYDAAGNAGIINIRLKKNKNVGTNGTLSLGYGVQRYSKYNTSLTLNHRTEKWNVYGNYGNNWGKSWSYMDFERRQNGSF